MNSQDPVPDRPDGEPDRIAHGRLGREKPLRAPESSRSSPPDAHGADAAIDEPPGARPAATALPGVGPPLPPALTRDRYPMHYDVEYPERLSRLKTFFRGFLIIPAWLFLYLVMGVVYAGFPAGWTTVFFKKRYPRWLFAANSGALGFMSRTWAYAALQTDRYPSFDTDTSPVTLEYDEPPQHQISRWRVFVWKGILLVPHFVLLSLLQVAVAVVVFLSWWAILFTGRYPRGMFGFATGITRWHLRVLGYFASFNDRFPPFALSADAGPASKATTVGNGVVGGLATGGLVALIVVAATTANDARTEAIDYARLRGATTGGITTHVAQGAVSADARGGRIDFVLAGVEDPGDRLVPLLTFDKGERVIVFEWAVRNFSDAGARVTGTADARLTIQVAGKMRTSSAELVVVGGQVAPGSIKARDDGKIQAVFILPLDARPVALRFAPDFTPMGGILYEFR